MKFSVRFTEAGVRRTSKPMAKAKAEKLLMLVQKQYPDAVLVDHSKAGFLVWASGR